MEQQVMETIARLRLVPVVVLREEKDALPLAAALRRGGLPVAEVTFRTAAAAGSIRAIRSSCPELLVGAGTVLTVEQARAARDAGAQFLVSPGLSGAVASFARAEGLCYLPGACTPTEVMNAMEMGFTTLKFFPAAQYGGCKTIQALGSVFPGVRFMPTGGVSPENLGEYLRSPRIIACGGSWMVKGELIAAGRFDEVERLTAQAVALVREAAV